MESCTGENKTSLFESGSSTGFENEVINCTSTGSYQDCSPAQFTSAEPIAASQSNNLGLNPLDSGSYSLIEEQNTSFSKCLEDTLAIDKVSNSQLKLYTRTECELIGGIWHANGECTKIEGGSYSWDNRTPNIDQKYTVKINLKDATLEYRDVINVEVYLGQTKLM